MFPLLLLKETLGKKKSPFAKRSWIAELIHWKLNIIHVWTVTYWKCGHFYKLAIAYLMFCTSILEPTALCLLSDLLCCETQQIQLSVFTSQTFYWNWECVVPQYQIRYRFTLTSSATFPWTASSLWSNEKTKQKKRIEFSFKIKAQGETQASVWNQQGSGGLYQLGELSFRYMESLV